MLRFMSAFSAVVVVLTSGLGVQIANAGNYYVATTGDDGNDGQTEATAWRSLAFAGSRAGQGDTVHIKAGNYGDDRLAPEQDGTPGAPIVFAGYKATPGDDPRTNWNYPDNTTLDPLQMPLLVGSDRSSGWGVTLNSRKHVIVRNLQVQNYEVAVYAWGAEHVTIDQIIARDLGALGTAYSGKGIVVGSQAYDNVVANSVVYNAGAEGISVYGDRNTVAGNRVYADDNAAPTDYYIVIGNGNDNTITGNYAERVGDLDHPGHGIGVKGDCTGNVFTDNVSVNFSGAFYVRHRGAMHNLFQDNTVRTGAFGILIRDGASQNTFRNMRVIGAVNSLSFMDTSEDEGLQWAGNDNLVVNSVFVDANCAVNFHSYSGDSPAYDNRFVNITVVRSSTLACGNRTNYGNTMTNSVIADVDSFERGPFEVDLVVEYSAFWNAGFAVPPGAGNIQGDPLFVHAAGGDFRLQDGSPAVDAGTSEAAPDLDMDGVARPQGAGFDMGAYEYSGDTRGTGVSPQSWGRVKTDPR